MLLFKASNTTGLFLYSVCLITVWLFIPLVLEYYEKYPFNTKHDPNVDPALALKESRALTLQYILCSVGIFVLISVKNLVTTVVFLVIVVLYFFLLFSITDYYISSLARPAANADVNLVVNYENITNPMIDESPDVENV